MFKYMLIAALISNSLSAAGKLTSPQVYVPTALGPTSVVHTPYGFTVNNQPVCPSRVDKVLRGAGAAAVHALMQKGYVKVGQATNGQYSLDYQARLKGGLAIGATAGFWLGKILTHAVVQTGIILTSAGATFLGGPHAGYVTLTTLEKTMWLPAEAASNKVGLGFGVIFGTATGPV